MAMVVMVMAVIEASAMLMQNLKLRLNQKQMLLTTEEEPFMDISPGPFTVEATEDTEASALLMLTLVMAVMVVTAVVLLHITEVVHHTSDQLSGVSVERSVMPMLMLTLMEVDTVSHTMPYLETLSSQDLPQSDIIQEEFLAV